jgi:hypothetical protein
MKQTLLILLFLLASVVYCKHIAAMSIMLILFVSAYSPCAKRYVRGDSQKAYMVCVCNATYCDDFPPLGTLNADSAAVYVSASLDKRFERSTLTWTKAKSWKAKKNEQKGRKLSGNRRLMRLIGILMS